MESPQVSAEAQQLYGVIADGGAIPDDSEEALAELELLGLVAPRISLAGGWRAIEPRTALQAKGRQITQQAAEMLRSAAELEATAGRLSAAYRATRPEPPDGSIERPADVDAANARIGELLAGARRELFVAQPTFRTQQAFDASEAQDLGLLQRGISKRTLYLDEMRHHAFACEYVEKMTRAGAEFRTASSFPRAIVVDRKYVVLPDAARPGVDYAAVIVTDAGVAAAVADVLEREWVRATPWGGEAAAGAGQRPGVALDPMQERIVRLVAQGVTQEAIPAMVGIPLRAVQRQIAEAKQILGAASTAALAYAFARWETDRERLR